ARWQHKIDVDNPVNIRDTALAGDTECYERAIHVPVLITQRNRTCSSAPTIVPVIRLNGCDRRRLCQLECGGQKRGIANREHIEVVEYCGVSAHGCADADAGKSARSRATAPMPSTKPTERRSLRLVVTMFMRTTVLFLVKMGVSAPSSTKTES